ncbi:hypothetical protein GBF38_009600 [Nibea albiflora]|uniref:Uncharacterized protein n=1 Tax=Nibea albiflora TaxID=240163 RepID=A0ACB7F911_NIBAL|nr:hypothetical protein GBF38_009600 [Nibea albiflora]
MEKGGGGGGGVAGLSVRGDGGKKKKKKEKEKKAREDRVNEMASKDELNGGRKETRSGLALLIDSSQTGSFQRRGEEEEEEERRRGDGVIMEAVERKHSEGAREDTETMVALQVLDREAEQRQFEKEAGKEVKGGDEETRGRGDETSQRATGCCGRVYTC